MADQDGVVVDDPAHVLGVGRGGEGAGVREVAASLQVGPDPGEQVGGRLDLVAGLVLDLGDQLDEGLELGVVPNVVQALPTDTTTRPRQASRRERCVRKQCVPIPIAPTNNGVSRKCAQGRIPALRISQSLNSKEFFLGTGVAVVTVQTLTGRKGSFDSTGSTNLRVFKEFPFKSKNCVMQ